VLQLDEVVIDQGTFRLTANWALDPGAQTAVIGPSGAGKSTLLHAIAGFVPARAGAIRWEGRDLSSLRPGDRPLTILFQDQNLFPHLTVQQNLGLGLSPSLQLTARDRSRMADALARVGLADMADRKPGSLSGGQQGRLALARALIRARPLLLLDEPFAALGPALRREMLVLVQGVAAETGSAVLMVTHDTVDAQAMALTCLVHDGVADPPRASGAVFAAPSTALAAYLGK
jgi:thiamine transport system ATP-binding protein